MYTTTYSPNDILSPSGQEIGGKGRPTHVENSLYIPYSSLDSSSDRRERPSNGYPEYTASNVSGSYYCGYAVYCEENSSFGKNSCSGRNSDHSKNIDYSEVNNLRSRDAAPNDTARPSIQPEPSRKNERSRVLPSTFGRLLPSHTDPSALFECKIIPPYSLRYTSIENSTTRLVFADGACTNNGRRGAQAGWGVIVDPELKEPYSENRYGRLGSRSKSGRWYPGPQTSSRAELCAVLAAMTMWDWKGEGCRVLVIATDSVYVYSGLTVWIKQWLKHSWINSLRQPVKNRDLWEELLDAVEKLAAENVVVRLWKIGREYNKAADALAKKAARMEPIE